MKLSKFSLNFGRSSEKNERVIAELIRRSIQNNDTESLFVLVSTPDRIPQTKERLESIVKSWGGTFHEGLWTGNVAGIRWSLTLEFGTP